MLKQLHGSGRRSRRPPRAGVPAAAWLSFACLAGLITNSLPQVAAEASGTEQQLEQLAATQAKREGLGEVDADVPAYLTSIVPGGSMSLVVTLRMTGADAVPFDTKVQGAMIRAANSTALETLGAIMFHRYKEGIASNSSDGVAVPYVDVETHVWDNAMRASADNATELADNYVKTMFGTFVQWVMAIKAQGLDVDVRLVGVENPPSIVATLQEDTFIELTPIALLRTRLDLCASDKRGVHALAEHVLTHMREELQFVPGEQGGGNARVVLSVTLARVLHADGSGNGSGSSCSKQGSGGGSVGVRIDVDLTVPVCPQGSINGSALVSSTAPEGSGGSVAGGGVLGLEAMCWEEPRRVVEDALGDAQWLMEGAATHGDASLQLVSLEPVPYCGLEELLQTLSNSSADSSGGNISSSSGNGSSTSSNAGGSSGGDALLPWYLASRASMPRNERDAVGTGVNIYLLSSGVLATHDEFRKPGVSSSTDNEQGSGGGDVSGGSGTQDSKELVGEGRRAHDASRVHAMWGIGGNDPLQDCDDAGMWHGMGTYGASLIAGLNLGVAPNASIYSVKFRAGCMEVGQEIWQPGGLPSAIDAVLSNFQSPGIMVIDTWWSESRVNGDDNEWTAKALTSRLDLAEARGIPVIVQAGGSEFLDVCNNVFANRTGTMVVSSVESHGFRSTGAPSDSPCIDLWAPGGNLAEAMTGASALGDDKYVDVVPRDAGGMYIVAGVAAQYLQEHHSTKPGALKQALQQGAVQGMLWDIGGRSLNYLANLSRPSPAADQQPAATESVSVVAEEEEEEGGGGLSTGVITGIVIAGIVIGLSGLLLAVLAVLIHRRRQSEGVHLRRYSSSSLKGCKACMDGGSGGGGGGPSGGGASGCPPRADSTSGLSLGTTPNSSREISGALTNNTRPLWESLSASADNILVEASGRGVEGLPSSMQAFRNANWLLDIDDITIERQADGSDWVLGAGSYGRVYRAIKGGVQRVAVKVIGRCPDGSNDVAFVREVVVMKAVCNDPNLVSFYGAVVTQRNLALVVELMNGGDLRCVLSNAPPGGLRWENFGKRVALDVVRGLVHLHSKRVIHRDIKSKNILLTRDGTAKIGDIGLAKVATNGFLSVDNSLGTFAWAAPEVIMGLQCTAAIDVYSFGVVLWELVTSEVPLRGALRDPMVPEECPQEVADILQNCLLPDPSARPTAHQLYSMLMACPPTPDQPWPPAPDGGGHYDRHLDQYHQRHGDLYTHPSTGDVYCLAPAMSGFTEDDMSTSLHDMPAAKHDAAAGRGECYVAGGDSGNTPGGGPRHNAHASASAAAVTAARDRNYTHHQQQQWGHQQVVYVLDPATGHPVPVEAGPWLEGHEMVFVDVSREVALATSRSKTSLAEGGGDEDEAGDVWPSTADGGGGQAGAGQLEEKEGVEGPELSPSEQQPATPEQQQQPARSEQRQQQSSLSEQQQQPSPSAQQQQQPSPSEQQQQPASSAHLPLPSEQRPAVGSMSRQSSSLARDAAATAASVVWYTGAQGARPLGANPPGAPPNSSSSGSGQGPGGSSSGSGQGPGGSSSGSGQGRPLVDAVPGGGDCPTVSSVQFRRPGKEPKTSGTGSAHRSITI